MSACACRRALFRLGLLAGAVGTACAAQGQEGSAAKPLQTVEIRGSATTYDPRRDDTASKIVVTQEELAKYGDTSIAEALKRVPGVTVNGSGRGAEIRMRGLGNGYTQILIDGQRAPANFSIDALSPDVIERIEVLRVASAEFSTQSIAGTINIVLKKSVKAGQRTLKLGYAHGAALVNPNASLQLSDKLDKLSYSLAASFSRARSEEDGLTAEQLRNAAGQVVASACRTSPKPAGLPWPASRRGSPGPSITATP